MPNLNIILTDSQLTHAKRICGIAEEPNALAQQIREHTVELNALYQQLFVDLAINDMNWTEEKIDRTILLLWLLYCHYLLDSKNRVEGVPSIDLETLTNYLVILSSFRHDLSFNYSLHDDFVKEKTLIIYHRSDLLSERKSAVLPETTDPNYFWIYKPISPQAKSRHIFAKKYYLDTDKNFTIEQKTLEMETLYHAPNDTVSSFEFYGRYYKTPITQLTYDKTFFDRFASLYHDTIPHRLEITQPFHCETPSHFLYPSAHVMAQLRGTIGFSLHFSSANPQLIESTLRTHGVRLVNLDLSKDPIVTTAHGMSVTNFDLLTHDLFYHAPMESWNHDENRKLRFDIIDFLRQQAGDNHLLTSLIWKLIDFEKADYSITNTPNDGRDLIFQLIGLGAYATSIPTNILISFDECLSFYFILNQGKAIDTIVTKALQTYARNRGKTIPLDKTVRLLKDPMSRKGVAVIMEDNQYIPWDDYESIDKKRRDSSVLINLQQATTTLVADIQESWYQSNHYLCSSDTKEDIIITFLINNINNILNPRKPSHCLFLDRKKPETLTLYNHFNFYDDLKKKFVSRDNCNKLCTLFLKTIAEHPPLEIKLHSPHYIIKDDVIRLFPAPYRKIGECFYDGIIAQRQKKNEESAVMPMDDITLTATTAFPITNIPPTPLFDAPLPNATDNVALSDRLPAEVETKDPIKQHQHKSLTINAHFKLSCLATLSAMSGAILLTVGILLLQPALCAMGGVLIVAGLGKLSHSCFFAIKTKPSQEKAPPLLNLSP